MTTSWEPNTLKSLNTTSKQAIRKSSSPVRKSVTSPN